MRIVLLLTAAASMLAGGAARAETIDVSGERSADLVELSRPGVKVRIVGPCQAECTYVLSQVPRSQICVTEGATLGLSLVRTAGGEGRPLYPYDIRAWMHRRSGQGHAVAWMKAPEIFRFFRRC
jgi:hypothetical protein